MAYYAMENNAQNGAGNGQHGTVVGPPLYVTEPIGCGITTDFNSNNHMDYGN